MTKQSIIKSPDNPPWAAELDERERAFVEEYVIDLRAGDAAFRAGIGKTKKAAIEAASRLRKKSHVAKAIADLIAERSGATGVAVLDEIARIAFAKATDFVKVEGGVMTVTDTAKLTDEQQSAISEISETVGEGGRTIKVKLHDKLPALDKLARALGLYKERAEVTHVIDATSVETVRSRITDRLNRLSQAMQGAPMAEIESPPRRIAPAPARVVRPIIDAE